MELKADKLKPGMIVVDAVRLKSPILVKEVDLKGKKKIFGAPNITYLEFQDPYYGFCSRLLRKDDTFVLLKDTDMTEEVSAKKQRLINFARKEITQNLKSCVESLEILDAIDIFNDKL